MRCDYCYVSKQPNRMSEAVAHKTVDFLMNVGRTQDKKGVEICFFGGEPLLEPGLIESTCKYALHSAKNLGCRLGFSMTTNGTLLDSRCLDMIRQFNIHTTISLDGIGKVQDRHRKTQGGQGSFSMIEKNLVHLSKAPRAAIRMTVTPDTVYDFVDSVLWFKDAGFKRVYATPVLEAEWNIASILAYADAWEEIYRQVGYHEAGKNDFSVGSIAKLHQRFQSGKNKQYGCGAARLAVAVDTMGDLYPCHRFIGYFRKKASTKIGDIFHGFKHDRRQYYINANLIANHIGCGLGLSNTAIQGAEDQRCSDCLLSWSCSGSCMAVNQYITDDPAQPPSIERIFAQIHTVVHLNNLPEDKLENNKNREEKVQ